MRDTVGMGGHNRAFCWLGLAWIALSCSYFAVSYVPSSNAVRSTEWSNRSSMSEGAACSAITQGSVPFNWGINGQAMFTTRVS
ncbi:hypothetical protein DFH29DRAFT_907719 [Suillus ampliporus]|nr:hypothetical protein DFH29DRAFT_907719 [Suillus ampliporus]